MLLRDTRRILHGGGSVEDALWALWDSTQWPNRLERAAQRGGNAGRAADRDLDAVCVLFDYAARAEDRAARRGVRNFIADLEAQELAGDTMAAQSSRGGAVRLMSAHKSKGLQWRFVIVAGVQDGLWPDLRMRGSLLAGRPDRPATGCAPPRTPRPRRRCWPRSGGCSTSRRPGPASGSW